MYAGMTLTALADELARQREHKRDFLAPPARIAPRFQTRAGLGFDQKQAGELCLDIPGAGDFAVRPHAERQLIEHAEIPWKYWGRMRAEQPGLALDNLRTWMAVDTQPRMVRTLDNRVRAYLSRAYRRIDNFDLAQVALDELSHAPGMVVESCNVDEHRLRIKARITGLEAAVNVGDVAHALLTIGNSETGQASLEILPGLYILRCKNGATVPDASLRAIHLGRRLDLGDEDDKARVLLSDDTKRHEDRALWGRVRDTVRAVAQPDGFNRLVQIARDAGQVKTETPPDLAVTVLAERYALPQNTRNNILKHLIEGGDLSQWGYTQAVTAAAQSSELDYNEASELEQLGGRILTLNPSDFLGQLARRN